MSSASRMLGIVACGVCALAARGDGREAALTRPHRLVVQPASDVPEGRQAAARADVLVACADPDNLPYSRRDGSGFENRIIELLGRAVGRTVSYQWDALTPRRVAGHLAAGRCDVVAGVAASSETLETTTPYYRSSFVFVTRADRPAIRSVDDPRLRRLRIGIQMTGDEVATPLAQLLALRGLAGHLYGYLIDSRVAGTSPPSSLVHDVAAARLDAAAMWGPTAGYFAARSRVPLRLTPARPAVDPDTGLRLRYDIGVGVRRGQRALLRALDGAVRAHRPEIAALLRGYGVPLSPAAAAEGRP